MNTIEDLNGAGAVQFEYTDNRNSGVVFDRATPTTQTFTYLQGDNHIANPGTNVIDIIRPTEADLNYIFSVSEPTNVTIVWPTMPTGVTIVNTSPGVYRLFGFTTAPQWQAIKNPTLVLDTGFTGSYTYTGTFEYNNGTVVSFTNTDVITDVVNLTVPSDTFYAKSSTQTLTGTPVIIDGSVSAIYTMTITPSNTALVSTLSSTGVGGTSSFNGTSKVLTIVGLYNQVNSHLNNIVYTSSTGFDAFTLTYDLSNNLTVGVDSQDQSVLSTEYWSPGSNGVFKTNTLVSVTNAPNITNNSNDTLESYFYTVDISADSPTTVTTMSATQYLAFNESDNVIPNPLGIGFIGFNTTEVNAAGTVLFAGHKNGSVYVYEKTGEDWNTTASVIITPPYGTEVGSITQLLLNTNEDTLFISSADGNATGTGQGGGVVFIYTASGTSWALQETLECQTRSLTENQSYNGFGSSINASADGNVLTVRSRRQITTSSSWDNGGGCVYVYNRIGTEWTLDQTITSPEYTPGDPEIWWLSVSVALSPNKEWLAIGDWNWPDNEFDGFTAYQAQGKVWIYRYNGSSYVLHSDLSMYETPTNSYISGDYFGQNIIFDYNGTTLFISDPAEDDNGFSSGVVYAYLFDGTNWVVYKTIKGVNEFDYVSLVALSKDNQTLLLGQGGVGVVYSFINGTFTKKYLVSPPPLTGNRRQFLGMGATDYELFFNYNSGTLSGPGTNYNLSVYREELSGTEFDADTKVLTLSGFKSQINDMLDSLKISTGFPSSNTLLLSYALNYNGSLLDTRTQVLDLI